MIISKWIFNDNFLAKKGNLRFDFQWGRGVIVYWKYRDDREITCKTIYSPLWRPPIELVTLGIHLNLMFTLIDRLRQRQWREENDATKSSENTPLFPPPTAGIEVSRTIKLWFIALNNPAVCTRWSIPLVGAKLFYDLPSVYNFSASRTFLFSAETYFTDRHTHRGREKTTKIERKKNSTRR